MKKKVPKSKMQEIKGRVIRNLIVGILIIAYFMVLVLAHSKLREDRLLGDIQVFAGTFLVIGIVFLEQAYRHNEGYRTVNGIEAIVLAAHTLSIEYVLNIIHIDFSMYMYLSSGVIVVYYILKLLMVFTLGKKQYIDSFSDISEIVKDEPQKKEAKKREVTKPTKTDNNKVQSKTNKKTSTRQSKTNKQTATKQNKVNKQTTSNKNKNTKTTKKSTKGKRMTSTKSSQKKSKKTNGKRKK